MDKIVEETFSLSFQVGMVKETVTLALTNDPDPVLRSQQERWVPYLVVKEAAVKFVQKMHPDQKLSEIFLFLHQSQNPNFLKLIVPQMDVPDNSVIEIVKINFPTVQIQDEAQCRPHILNIHSYKSPHFCEFCGEMLWGLVKQGLKCEACGLNYHKRCAYKIPNDCQAKKNINHVAPNHVTNSRRVSLDDPNENMRLSANYSSPMRIVSYTSQASRFLQIPHSFVTHTFNLPTVCQLCHRLLPLLRQNLQCKDCKFNCHKKCADFVPNNCLGESKSMDGDSSDGAIQDSEIEDGEVPEMSDTSQKLLNFTALKNDAEERQKNLASAVSNNIPLQRVVQSFKNTKKADGTQVIRSDWLISYTNKDPTRRRHYWKLEPLVITLFTDENTNRYYKEILLRDVTRLELVTRLEHVFELVAKEIVYYVSGDKAEGGSAQSVSQAVAFEKTVRQAMLPLNNNQTNKGAANGSIYDNGKIKDINECYEIFPQEVLGSGQFGIVYGAIHRHDKHPVAIKVIDKLRFPNKQEAQLKNEVSILQNIQHPGVVNLEYMFETADKIYVVMEKLQGDMLEMILGNPEGKLCERVTRFLVYQILIALKDLHQKHIVHCDLKPENVLLSSNASFPLVKLCDFGFAKIIGEKSFRRSVVGTPAYLAPEVLKNKGYNRSLDMWSVGVILYVSLSGTFPFNEDEDINEQIQNADFMFPSNLWSRISKTAIDLITKILQVHFKNRFTVDRSLNHEWLQDYQCFCDLRKLEDMVGQRYLTAEADEMRWEEYRQNKKLPHWSTNGMKSLVESQRL